MFATLSHLSHLDRIMMALGLASAIAAGLAFRLAFHYSRQDS